MNKLRCGIIGFDFGHQGAFADCLARLEQVQIVGVADLSDAAASARERGRQFAQRWGAPYFDDYTALLEAQELDMVSLCLPPARNPDAVERMCARGIHVMSEKPIAADGAGTQRIARAVRAAGVRFTFAFHAARFSRPVARALGLVRAGAVGEVRVLNGMLLQSRGPRYTISVPEAQRRRAAGEPSVGELANFGGYVFLTMSALAAAPLRSVFAETEAYFYDSYRIAGIEDTALVTVEFGNGVVGTMVVGRTTTKSLPTADARYEIVGSEGVLHVDFAHGDRMLLWGEYRDDDEYERGGLEMVNFSPPSYELYCRDFVQALIAGREPELTIQDALDFDAFLAAAYQSAQSHQVVHVS